MIRIYRSSQTNVYFNLAMELYLLRIVEAVSDNVLLYFWRNENAVVLGRNQDAFLECNMVNAEKCSTQVARRITGGGAVFHDLGNLNFSVILPRLMYDRDMVTKVLVTAFRKMGIESEASGRNDILACGRKFSGCAFYTNPRAGLYHGTVLIDTNFGRMKELLTVSQEKLARHGIASVESRVVNLREIKPGITIEKVQEALKNEFVEAFGGKPSEMELSAEATKECKEIETLYRSRSWIFSCDESLLKELDKYNAIC